jgi:hypothetical protein
MVINSLAIQLTNYAQIWINRDARGSNVPFLLDTSRPTKYRNYVSHREFRHHVDC